MGLRKLRAIHPAGAPLLQLNIPSIVVIVVVAPRASDDDDDDDDEDDDGQLQVAKALAGRFPRGGRQGTQQLAD